VRPPGLLWGVNPDLAHAWALYQHLYRVHLVIEDARANQALGKFINAH
jgi:hypothetical protein